MNGTISLMLLYNYTYCKYQDVLQYALCILPSLGLLARSTPAVAKGLDQVNPRCRQGR